MSLCGVRARWQFIGDRTGLFLASKYVGDTIAVGGVNATSVGDGSREFTLYRYDTSSKRRQQNEVLQTLGPYTPTAQPWYTAVAAGNASTFVEYISVTSGDLSVVFATPSWDRCVPTWGGVCMCVCQKRAVFF